MDTYPHVSQQDFPAIHPKVHKTPGGVSFLKSPGFVLISQPHFNPAGLRPFLAGFDEELDFTSYLDDPPTQHDGPALVKTAGQLCYMSFGPGRTKNAEGQKYVDNLKEQKHGSVFQHANYTGLFYGIDRAVSHELVRHAAGNGFSQVSQRYVDGKALRYVMPVEVQGADVLEGAFCAEIERNAQSYAWWADQIFNLQKDAAGLQGDKARDRRKRVNQAARRVLMNATEAPIIMTGNGRSWRHFLEQRANRHADMSIRMGALVASQALKHVATAIFSDYAEAHLEDGVGELTTAHVKV